METREERTAGVELGAVRRWTWVNRGEFIGAAARGGLDGWIRLEGKVGVEVNDYRFVSPAPSL